MIRTTLRMKSDRPCQHSGGEYSGRLTVSQTPAWTGLGPRQPLSSGHDKFILLQDLSTYENKVAF